MSSEFIAEIQINFPIKHKIYSLQNYVMDPDWIYLLAPIVDTENYFAS